VFAQIKGIKYFRSVSKNDLKILTAITYICNPKLTYIYHPKLCRVRRVLTEIQDAVAVQLKSKKNWEL